MSHPDLQAKLRAARQRRAPLFADAATTAFRWVNGAGDGVPAVTVDGFGAVAMVSLYEDLTEPRERALVEAVVAAFSPASVYLKRRPREARVVATTRKDELAPELPAAGEPVESLEVLELGLRYRIRPAQGLAVGLYLDMRDTRAWVREHAAGKRVLNCFSYTCGFGVSAVAGGAARALNVDLSRRVLDWGEENLALNGQTPRREDHLSGDVFEWLVRLARKKERFDLVVLDPPSFSTSQRGRFSAAKDYPRLVEQAAPLVEGGGTLVACCNLAQLEARRFEEQVHAGLARAGRRAVRIERLGASPIDFPPPWGLKVIVATLGAAR